MRCFPRLLIALAGAAVPQLVSAEVAAPVLKHWQAPIFWGPGTVARPTGENVSGRHPLTVSSTPLPFVALPPCRLVDTRAPAFPAPLGGGFLPPATARTYILAGVCNVPANAQAISLNATVTNPAGPGFLVLWAKGATVPPVSTLAFVGGETVANEAIVPLSVDGGVSVALGVSGADLILDTNGYYAPLSAVTSLNALTGDLTLQAGANTSITPSGNSLTISSSGGLTGVTAGTGIAVSGGPPSPTVLIPPAGIQADRIASGQVVKSVNGAQDAVSIVGNGVTVSTVGNTVTLSILQGAMMYGPPGDTKLTNAGFIETRAGAVDFWMPTSVVNVPSPRSNHTAVWTGSKMIIWGGLGRTPVQSAITLNTGAIYDPTTDNWTPISTVNAPAARYLHTAVWTGGKMIVWGGLSAWYGSPLQTGGIYDPASDTWAPVTVSGAPSARAGHTAVWTGSRMVAWGGSPDTSGTPLADGGQYDPALDSWSATTMTGGPTARVGHTAVWTGNRMIVWGGQQDAGGLLGDGAVYFPGATPGTDSWTLTSTVGSPSPRFGHSALWTGTQMLIWAAQGDSSGGLYDPLSNVWSPTTLDGAASAPQSAFYPQGKTSFTGVWTGSRALYWGGDLATLVYQYSPATDSWTFPTTTGAPAYRIAPTGVWTGTRFIVWGGQGTGGYLSSGGQWMPLSLYVKN